MEGWHTYSSPEYGYSLSYPPAWFDLGSFGSPGDEHYFSNDQAAGSPVTMQRNDVFLGVSANCQYILGGDTTLINQSNVTIDAVPAIRYVAAVSTPDGNFVGAITTVEPGAYCYRVFMLAFTVQVIQSNLPDFDTLLSTIHFSARSSPAVSPRPTNPPR
jgi:hypothetical protein